MARSTRWSARGGPMSWMPTGRPALVRPAGIEAAGWPVRLHGSVKGAPFVQRGNAAELYSVSTGGAAVGVTGANRMSYLRCHSARSRASLLLASYDLA